MSATIDKIAGSFDRVSRGARAASERMHAFGERISSIGKSMVVTGAEMVAPMAAVGFGAYKAVEAAGDVDAAMKHLSTALDEGQAGTREYAEAQRFAEEMSVKFNYSQVDIINSLYHSTSFLGDFNAAMKATAVSLAVAKGNMGDAAQVGGLLGIVINDFADKTRDLNPQIQHMGDLMAYISRHGAFLNVTQLNDALSISIGAAKAAGMSFEDTIATLNAFQAVGLQGAEAGSALNESLAAFARGKLQSELGVALAKTAAGGLDVIGTFVNLRHELGAGTITIEQFQRASKALGIRGERALTIDVGALEKMRQTLQGPAVVGAAMSGAQRMLSAFTEQVGRLGRRWDILLDAIGSRLIPIVQNQLIPALDRALVAMTKFVESGRLTPIIESAKSTLILFLDIVGAVGRFVAQHPALTNFALKFGAISVALSGIAGALSIATGGFLMLGGTALRAISYIPAVLGFLLSPIGLVVAGLAAIGFAAYEIYEHWNAIKPALLRFWDFIKPENLFATLLPEFFEWGGHLIAELGRGILHGVEAEIPGPLKALGEKIMGFFPHSPAKEGPLADLDKVDILGEIIQTIKGGTDSLGSALGGALSSALRGVSGVVHAGGAAVSNAWQSIRGLVGAGPAAILHGLMGTESSFGWMLTNPLSSAIGPYQMTRAFRAAFGVSPAQAMDIKASTEVANRVIFGKYLPEFGGDMAKALSAWHQGEGWVRRHGVDVAYVNNVMRHMTHPTPATLALQLTHPPLSMLAPQITSMLPTEHSASPVPAGSPPASLRATAQAPIHNTTAQTATHNITIHYAPNINAAGMNHRELLGVLRQHARELGEIVARGDDRRRRLAFEG